MNCPSTRPVLIFDGKCGFCRIWIDYWRIITGDSIEYAPSQEVGEHYPQIPKTDFATSVQLVQQDGTVLQGARAVFETFHHSPSHRFLLWLYNHIPLIALLTEWGYKKVAAQRNIAYWLTIVLFGKKIEPARFHTVEWLFVRALAAIYTCAFASFGVQAVGLVGSNGILPAATYLAAVRANFGTSGYWLAPSVFWINAGDTALKFTCIAGCILAVALFAGIAQRVCLIALFLLYLSLCSIGQDFLSFQWDMLLLETGFLTIFLGSSKLVIWLFRWLLFRLMFLSGAVKLLSHDAVWRNLDALRFHYWTQPLPTPLAWYMNQLPPAVQRFSTWTVFLIELVVPFLIFLPRRPRLVAASFFLFLQVMILLTGNYAFFNLLAIALCLFLLDDRVLGSWKPSFPRPLRIHPGIAIAAALIIGLLSCLSLASTLFNFVPGPAAALLRVSAPFGIVNSYGLFAVMTTTRPEIIVQGSADGSAWLDYEFRYKPGDVRPPPRWVAPHQPRLDWQIWFAALSDWRSSPWFANFMVRLLQGSPPVSELLAKNPFPAKPPKYVRALLFEYRFTSWTERSATGAWWKRTPKSVFFPAITLDDVSRHEALGILSPVNLQFAAQGAP